MDISLYRMLPPDAQESLFVNSVPLMNVISHEIEDVIINNQLPVDFYAGFQRFSFFARQLNRYRRLAQVCRRVYIWGVPDITPPNIPGVEYIPLTPEMELAREWFLVVDTPGFFTALLTREETYGQTVAKGQRRFRGVWTYDPDLVGRAYLLVSQILGQNFRPNVQRNYQTQNQYLVQISNRLVQRQDLIDQALTRSQLIQHGLNQSETPLLVLDAQTKVIAASSAVGALLNLAPEAVAGQTLEQLGGGVLSELDLNTDELTTAATVRGPNNLPLALSATALRGRQEQNLGWAVRLITPEDLRREPPSGTPSVNLPIAPMLQKYLGGIQQLLAMMPSLAARQDIQLRVVGQMQRMVSEMNSQVGRLNLLQMLEAQQQVTTEAHQLSDLLQPLITEFQARASEQGQSLTFALQEMLPYLHCDAEQLRLAVRELLDNALRYAPSSPIVLEVQRQNGQIQISVQDSGPGIDSLLQQRIFEPFFRPDGTETQPGNGLGLALARAIARGHGGQLVLKSSPGSGSRFTLSLPPSA